MFIEGPFNGITVLDLTRVLAGPYCTMLLADLGARVIKIEPPGGDDARQFGPFIEGRSAYFASLNRGKLGVVLDLKSPEGKKEFNSLLENADILVENYRPLTMEKLGYGWDYLKGKYPKLIYAAVSGFGHSGPYSQRPAYDMVVQGMGGIMSITGEPGGGPVRVGTSVGDITAGLFTALGIASALYDRQISGKGGKIDVAMLDCQVAILENALARYFSNGEIPQPLGTRHPSIYPFAAFLAGDNKHIIIAAASDLMFQRLCQALARPDLLQNPNFATNALRAQNHALLAPEIEAGLKNKSAEKWLEILAAHNVPSAPINNIADVVNDPQIKARNMIVEVDYPDNGPLKMAGNPIKMSNFPDKSARKPAPELNYDINKILHGTEK